MAMDEKIKTSDELEFAVFCIENVAAKLVRDGVSDMHCMSAVERMFCRLKRLLWLPLP